MRQEQRPFQGVSKIGLPERRPSMPHPQPPPMAKRPLQGPLYTPKDKGQKAPSKIPRKEIQD